MIVADQLPSCVQLCTPMDCSQPGLPVPHHLPKFAPVHVHCIGDTIQPSHPLMPSLLLPSIFPSFRDFFNELAFASDDQNTGVSVTASVLPMSIELISLKIDQFDLLAVQGTQKSSPAPQFKGINSSCSAFFMVQLSQLYLMIKSQTRLK